MTSRRLLFVAITAGIYLPAPAVAQRGFVGVGAGASRIDPESRFVPLADTRPSIALRAGLGGRRFKVVLDWQRHGLGDDQPLATDYRNGIMTRRPRVLGTDFLLLGAQIHLTRGFYLRPAVGLGRNGFPAYFVPNGTDAEGAEVSHEAALTAGLSVGYHLRVHRGLGLAIEASALSSPGEDSSEGRRVIGIQVIPLFEF